MPRSNDHTPTLVGLFLFVGLAILGLLVLQYGKLQRGKIPTYTLAARFSDATGIIKGSDVRLGGAKVGQVAALPQLNETFDRVLVQMDVYKGIDLPRNAEVTVAGAGLLGDKYVSIQVPAGTNPAKVGYYEEGETIEGLSAGSLTSLQVKVENLSDKVALALTDVQAGVAKISTTFDKFNTGVLSDQNLADFQVTVRNLRKTSENLADASAKIGPFLEKGEKTLDKGGKTFDDIDAAIADVRTFTKELKPIGEKIKKSVDDIGSAAQSFEDGVHRLTTTGDGLLPGLISDRSLRDEFSAFINNSRRNGLLFYKDEAEKKSPGAETHATDPALQTVMPWDSRNPVSADYRYRR